MRSTASRKMSKAALTMKAQMTTLASGSIIGTPSRAPAMPISAPTELRASERWCHASAINAGDASLRA